MIVLNFIRQWWRPVAAVGMAVSVWVNGVVLPLTKQEYPDMIALAALFGAVSAAFAVREAGKIMGHGESHHEIDE